VRAIELRAQPLEPAREARLHRRDRHALPPRDRARREVLEEPQHDRLAVRLGETEHGLDDRRVLRESLDVLERRRLRLGRGRVPFARAATSGPATVLEDEVADGGGQPRG
jgi:hypothetical protein